MEDETESIDPVKMRELKERLHPAEAEKGPRKDNTVKILMALGAVVIIIGIFAMVSSPKTVVGDSTACFKHDVCINLTVLTDAKSQEIGLSNYSSFPSNRGMLFIFDKVDIQRMWMKDMNFPIDMIWISDKGKILHIEKKALPCTSEMTSCEVFEPAVNAKYVLETNEGFAIDTNLFDGDKVVFTNLP